VDRVFGRHHVGRETRRREGVAGRDGRAAAREEGVTADQLIEKSATRLRELADRAASRGDGVSAWLSKELRADASFLRKLKPSLIAARARGETPPTPGGEVPPSPEQTPQEKRKRSGGPPPLAIVGAAFVAGIVIAKVIDWRGHAHPRD
jgi:hypothetical protein